MMQLYEYVKNANVVQAPKGYDPVFLQLDSDTMYPASGGFWVYGTYTIYGDCKHCAIRIQHPKGLARTAKVYRRDASYD